ncbi:serine/threonine-protein kinase [Gordonia shandongensis]|uniref:serine/threonine-protein kinase n=1 Tax=Gordonia shandongensis TaxID=376351 RepID=UPI0003F6FD3D|nr:serine/threonine-protein kinase [Gordonia shandongensis]
MFQIGDEIAGYRIEQVLGAGGMGEVYRAAHPRLPRSDAIKVLRSAHGADPVVRQRFEREADLMAPLAHPNLVRVYDRGVVGDGLWIAMEFVPGTDAARMSQNSPGGMDPRLVVAIVNGVAAGLDVAHRHGVLHRDVKPANILITPGVDPVSPEAVKVTDFGIAQALGDAGAALTSTGTTIGTMKYCSPEQIDGRAVDGRSDVYSLAATALELLTGSAPFISDSIQGLMTAHMFSEPPRASERVRSLPPAVDDVLRAGMSKDPAGRPPTAMAFANALYSAFTGGTVTLPPRPFVTAPGAAFANTPGAPVPGPRQFHGGPSGPMAAGPVSWYRKVPVVASLAVIVALGAGVGGAFAWNAAAGLGTPSAPDVQMVPAGVEMSWDGVDGADRYLIKEDDRVVGTTAETSYTVTDPTPGERTYSVAARGSSDGSDFSPAADLTVTQTWGQFLDIAKLYPDLIPSTPVNTSTFESLECRGLGAYPAGDETAARAIICEKSENGTELYSVGVYAGTTPLQTRYLSYSEVDRSTSDIYTTTRGTEGHLRVGTANGDAKAIFTYQSTDEGPHTNTYVSVTVPKSTDEKKAREIMERLPL